jgi:hypothetical protein
MKRRKSKRIDRRALRGKPFKLEGTAELIGDLDRGLEELKQERMASFQRLVEELQRSRWVLN